MDSPHAAAVAKQPAASSAAAGFDAIAVLAALWQHKVFLLICGLLGAGLAVGASKFITHRYVATAELLVDPRDLRVLDKEVMPRAGESDSGITVVESQVQVLSSNSVLKRAIEKLGLQNDPEFNGTQRNVLSAALGSVTGLFSSPKEVDHSLAALQTLRQRIGVKRPERTFIVEMSVSSNDPDKSVRIADAIIAAYLEDQAQFRASSNEGAAVALDSGLKAMQDQVNAAEQKIASYKAINNLGLASGKLVVEQQLSDANNQLALARAATDRIKAQLNDMERSRAAPQSMPEIMASPSLINLKKQLATVTAERARFAAQLMPKHPVMVTLNQQERAVRAEMDREIVRVSQSIRHDYERAKANELSLAQAVERLKGEMNAAAQAQIQLRELERNFEVTQSLYQQSVARARETREQSRLNTTNVRIISSAMPLPARVFPPRGIILAVLGFMIGAGIGAMKAVFPLVRRFIASHSSATASPQNAVARVIKPEARESDIEISTATPAMAVAEDADAQRKPTTEKPERVSKIVDVAPAKAIASEPVRVDPLESSVEIIPVPAQSVELTPAEPAAPVLEASAAIEVESAIVPPSPRQLVSDMRAASRAAQTLWLREGTSAMAVLARSVSKSSDTAFADHIRLLQAYVNGRADGGGAGRTIWFVSQHGVPIKPVIALAFAQTFVAEGKRVLIVDADVRTPGLTRLLVADNQLTARTTYESRGRICQMEEPSLDVLIVNDPKPAAIVAALEAAKPSYDIIVVDARVDALAADLDTSHAVFFVSSSRPNEPVADPDEDGGGPGIPRICGTILTAKGLSSSASTSAVSAHAV